MKGMPSSFALAGRIVLLAGTLAAVPAPASASIPLRSTFAPSARVVVSLQVATSARGALIELEANRIRLHAVPGGVVLRRGGRALTAVLPTGRPAWRAVRLAVSAGGRRGSLTVGSRVRSFRLMAPERAVRTLGSGRQVRRVKVRTTPAAAGGRTSVQAGAAAPPSMPATPPSAAAPASGRGTAPSTALATAPIATLPPATPAAAAPAPAPLPRFFAPNSIWNARLADDVPLDPRSSVYVADLRRQLGVAAPWINTVEYSSPIYTVGSDEPTRTVVLDTNYSPLARAWVNVPLSLTAKPAAGSDGHLVLHQPSTDTMWEFYRLKLVDGVWHARWGARMDAVSTDPGHYAGAKCDWGATATSLSLAGGLMTLDELAAGRIDHALALSIPQARARVWSYPAQRTDGSSTSPDSPTEGMRFRLDPTLDLSTLQLPRIIRLMAEAVQRHGMIVRDQAGAVVFSSEDPTPTGANPYGGPTGYFEGQYRNKLLAKFPWDRLQVVAAPTGCCWKQ